MPTKPIASEDIYDALVDDGCFARLPRLLAAAFGGRSALIHWLYPDGGGEMLSHTGWFSDDHLGRYASEFAPLDPWIQATDKAALGNRALSLEDVVPPHDYANSFFYNEFIVPMGDDTFRCMGVRVVNDWGSGIVAIHRGRRQQSFRPEAVAALEQHVQTLRRMLAVRGRLAAVNRRLDTMEAMLDHLGQAAILVSAAGGVVHANAAGEALLWRGDALVQHQGSLSARSGASAVRLKAAIGQACASFGMEAGALLIERPSGRPLVVSVMPFRAPGGLRHALLIIENECRSGDAVAPRLRALYGLTRAEAEIGTRLADGVGTNEIAAERGVSVETVRSQIKSLAAKLGCGRRSEIVALVNAMPSMNAAGREPPAIAMPLAVGRGWNGSV